MAVYLCDKKVYGEVVKVGDRKFLIKYIVGKIVCYTWYSTDGFQLLGE